LTKKFFLVTFDVGIKVSCPNFNPFGTLLFVSFPVNLEALAVVMSFFVRKPQIFKLPFPCVLSRSHYHNLSPQAIHLGKHIFLPGFILFSLGIKKLLHDFFKVVGPAFISHEPSIQYFVKMFNPIENLRS